MDLDQLIADNLRFHRARLGLSIGQLAEQTGLSKAVISQLEKGGANPTVNTLCRLAEALRQPLSALLEPRPVSARRILRSELPRLDGEAGTAVTCYFPVTPRRRFECFLLELAPGARHDTAGHSENSEEYLIVREGPLTVVVAGKVFLLDREDALFFDGGQAHSYRNDGSRPASAYSISYYPE